MRESFYDATGVIAASGVSLVPVAGTKKGVAISTGAAGSADQFRVQYGSMYLDQAGAIGPAGRMHYWYHAYFFTATNYTTYQWASCYAYCDNPLAATPDWIKPSLGLVAWNGNTNNNIIRLDAPSGGHTVADMVYVGGVAVFPERTKRFVFVLGGGSNVIPSLWESDSIDLSGATKIRDLSYACDHVELAATYDGKLVVTMQNDFTTTSYPTQSRSFVVEVLSDFANDPWRADMQTVDLAGYTRWGQSVLGGVNVVTSTENVIPPETQQHGGKWLTDVADAWGRVALLSPETYADSTSKWDSALFALRNYADGAFTAAADVARIGTTASEKIVSYGAGGAFDAGSVMMVSNSYHELADGTIRAYYNGYNLDYTVYSVNGNPQTNSDQIKTALLEWRKDGLTKLSGSGTFITPVINKTSGNLVLNYVGDVDVEVLDVNGQVLPGYARADCSLPVGDYLAQPVSWGGNSSADLTGVIRLKFYLSGADLFAYELPGSGIAPTRRTTGIVIPTYWGYDEVGLAAYAEVKRVAQLYPNVPIKLIVAVSNVWDAARDTAKADIWADMASVGIGLLGYIMTNDLLSQEYSQPPTPLADIKRWLDNINTYYPEIRDIFLDEWERVYGRDESHVYNDICDYVAARFDWWMANQGNVGAGLMRPANPPKAFMKEWTNVGVPSSSAVTTALPGLSRENRMIIVNGVASGAVTDAQIVALAEVAGWQYWNENTNWNPYDRTSNWLERQAAVLSSVNPPLLTINSALPTTAASQTLSGTVTAGSIVTVNGEAAAVSGTTWSYEAALSVGSNAFTVVAERYGLATTGTAVLIRSPAPIRSGIRVGAGAGTKNADIYVSTGNRFKRASVKVF